MDPNLLDDNNARLNQYCSGYSLVYKNTFVWDVVASSSPPAQPTRSQSAPASMITIAASSVQQLGHDDWPSTDIPSTQPLAVQTSNDIPVIVAAHAVLPCSSNDNPISAAAPDLEQLGYGSSTDIPSSVGAEGAKSRIDKQLAQKEKKKKKKKKKKQNKKVRNMEAKRIEEDNQFDMELDELLEDPQNQFLEDFVCTSQDKMDLVFYMWQDSSGDWIKVLRTLRSM